MLFEQKKGGCLAQDSMDDPPPGATPKNGDDTSRRNIRGEEGEEGQEEPWPSSL